MGFRSTFFSILTVIITLFTGCATGGAIRPTTPKCVPPRAPMEAKRFSETIAGPLDEEHKRKAFLTALTSGLATLGYTVSSRFENIETETAEQRSGQTEDYAHTSKTRIALEGSMAAIEVRNHKVSYCQTSSPRGVKAMVALPPSEWARLRRVKLQKTAIIFDCQGDDPGYCASSVKEGFKSAVSQADILRISSIVDAPDGASAENQDTVLGLGANHDAAYLLWLSVRPKFDRAFPQDNLQRAYTWVSAQLVETSDGRVLFSQTLDPGGEGKGIKGMVPIKLDDGSTWGPADTVKKSVSSAQKKLADILRFADISLE